MHEGEIEASSSARGQWNFFDFHAWPAERMKVFKSLLFFLVLEFFFTVSWGFFVRNQSFKALEKSLRIKIELKMMWHKFRWKSNIFLILSLPLNSNENQHKKILINNFVIFSVSLLFFCLTKRNNLLHQHKKRKTRESLGNWENAAEKLHSHF